MTAATLNRRLRRVLAGLLGLDLLIAVVGGWSVTHAVAPPPDATVAWVLARSVLAPLLALCVGGFALWRFASGPRRWAWGWAALIVLTVPLYAYTSVARGFHGHFLHAGAALLGWLLAGGAAAMWQRRAATDDDDGAVGSQESWAAVGALGAFAATHVNAGLAKLTGLGMDAVSPWIIQLSLHMDHAVGAASPLAPIWEPVLASPALAGAVAWLFLLAELGAVLLLAGPRVRRPVAVGLVLYHALMSALFGMVFYEALVILAVLAWPSQDWGGPVGRHGRRRLAQWAGVASAALVAVLLWPAADGEPPRASPVIRATAPVAPTPEDLDAAAPVETFGPLRVGGELPGGWRIAHIGTTSTLGVLRLVHTDTRIVHLILAAGDVPAGPFDAGTAVLGYRSRTVGLAAFRPAADQVASMVRAAGAGDEADAVRRWLSAPPGEQPPASR